MTKSGRAKREKKKDFLKKKIKVGKTLKKAQNETITTFKSRSIHVMEQLIQKDASDHVTRKRYSMAELCKRLSHTSFNHRVDACRGIKELISKLDTDEIRSDLSLLINALSPCVLTDDVKLRCNVVKLVEMLVKRMSTDNLAPHFTLLGRHLCCGLVSLHAEVQDTALKLLQILLQNSPILVLPFSTQLLPNLMRLLGSKIKSDIEINRKADNNGNKNCTSESRNRKQSSCENTGFKDSDVALVQAPRNSLLWQLEVLVQLTTLLTHIHAAEKPNDNLTSNSTLTYWQLIYTSWFATETDTRHCHSFLSDLEKLQPFCGTVIHVANSLWRSLLPDANASSADTGLSSTSAHCLCCLIDLHNVLASSVRSYYRMPYTECEWFVDLVRPILKRLLRQHFPVHYYLHGVGKKKPKSSENYIFYQTRSADAVNLQLAGLGVQYGLFEQDKLTDLVQFFQGLMACSDKIGQYDMSAFCQLLLELIDKLTNATHAGLINSKLKTCDELILAAFNCYKSLHPLKKERKLLLSFLLTITDHDHKIIMRLPSAKSWCDYIAEESARKYELGVATSPDLLICIIQLLLRGTVVLTNEQYAAIRATHQFVKPTKAVFTPEDVDKWEKSEAYQDILGFLTSMNESVRGKPCSSCCVKSEVVVRLLSMLDTMSQWVSEYPPVEQPQRYGNKAFRDYFAHLVKEAEALVKEVVSPEFEAAAEEVSVYLTESIGNSTRIDYGTGHELAFMMFLCCLYKIGSLTQDDAQATVGLVFKRYLELVRQLQMTYKMEPAGSQGVWSLDDYQFVPFIWGSSQLVMHPKIAPEMFTIEKVVNENADEYLFLASIKFILGVKSGPFAEHSNQLWNISGVQSWSKINQGLFKMYKAEVLHKFPVVQHLLFGSLLCFHSASKILHQPPSASGPLSGLGSVRPPFTGIDSIRMLHSGSVMPPPRANFGHPDEPGMMPFNKAPSRHVDESEIMPFTRAPFGHPVDSGMMPPTRAPFARPNAPMMVASSTPVPFAAKPGEEKNLGSKSQEPPTES